MAISSTSFKKGHQHSKETLFKISETWFKKGNKVNKGRKRPDMIGNDWGRQFQKGHLVNLTTGIAYYRKLREKRNCEVCGKKYSENKKNLKRKKYSPNLDIHHIDGNRTNYHKTNLMVCCRSCHMKIHIKRGDIDYKKRKHISWNKGKKGLQTAWNKGLMKHTDIRMMAISKKMMGNTNNLKGG